MQLLFLSSCTKTYYLVRDVATAHLFEFDCESEHYSNIEYYEQGLFRRDFVFSGFEDDIRMRKFLIASKLICDKREANNLFYIASILIKVPGLSLAQNTSIELSQDDVELRIGMPTSEHMDEPGFNNSISFPWSLQSGTVTITYVNNDTSTVRGGFEMTITITDNNNANHVVDIKNGTFVVGFGNYSWFKEFYHRTTWQADDARERVYDGKGGKKRLL